MLKKIWDKFKWLLIAMAFVGSCALFGYAIEIDSIMGICTVGSIIVVIIVVAASQI